MNQTSKETKYPTLTNMLFQYLAVKPREPLLKFLSRKNPYVFAHHPPDACFSDHVFHIAGFHICKGCTMTSLGFLAGLIMLVITRWLDHVTVLQTSGLFIAMLLPTIITSLLPIPRYLKNGARFILGCLLASSIWAIFILPWWAKFVVVGTCLAIKLPLTSLRNRKNRLILEAAEKKHANVKHGRTHQSRKKRRR